MVETVKYFTDNEILIKPETARRNGCLVSKSGVVVDANGNYVVKAGTPLYGTKAGMNRETALTVAAVGTTNPTTPQGILYQDVVFGKNENTANGVLVINGEVDWLKLDATVQALLTDTVQGALTHIQFTKGRAD